MAARHIYSTTRVSFLSGRVRSIPHDCTTFPLPVAILPLPEHDFLFSVRIQAGRIANGVKKGGEVSIAVLEPPPSWARRKEQIKNIVF